MSREDFLFVDSDKMKNKDFKLVIRDLLLIALVVVIIAIASIAFFVTLGFSGLGPLDKWIFQIVLVFADFLIFFILIWNLLRIALNAAWNWIPDDEEDPTEKGT